MIICKKRTIKLYHLDSVSLSESFIFFSPSIVWKLAYNILLDGCPAAGFVCEQNLPPDMLQIVTQVCGSENCGICYSQDPLNLLVWC